MVKRNYKDRGCKLLIVEVPEEMHKKIKVIAAVRGITVTEWTLRALAMLLEKEDVVYRENV